MIKHIRSITALLLLAGTAGAQAASYCGDLKTHFGPFDYRERVRFAENFDTVERAHFTPDVENGVRGATTKIGGDIAYTLHAIPNHHRALAAMARYALRTKSVHLESAKYSVECYFNRAIRFQPDDGGAHMVYGSFLFKLGRSAEALGQFNEAVKLEPENGTANYNLGLAYFQKKDYDNALIFAKKAEALGFPLTGLKNKFVAMGKWNSAPAK